MKLNFSLVKGQLDKVKRDRKRQRQLILETGQPVEVLGPSCAVGMSGFEKRRQDIPELGTLHGQRASFA
jgi:hypothetical protein